MTSIPAADMGLNVPYITETGAPNANAPGNFADSFQNAMKNQAGSGSFSEKNTDVSNLKTSTDTQKAVKPQKTDNGTPDRKDVTDEKVNRPEDRRTDSADRTDDVSPETADAVKDAAQKVVDETAEEMDVSPEEVMDAMETLGLSMIDLLDPNNMTQLVAQISGEGDTVSLLTDENLYTTLGNLQDFVTDTTESLMEELDLSQEAFGEVLAQTEELMQQPMAADMNLEPMDGMNKDVPLEGLKDFSVRSNVNGEQITMDVTVDDATGAQTAVIRSTGDETGKNPSDETGKHGEGEQDAHGRDGLFAQTVQLNTNTQLPDITQMVSEAADFRSQAAEIADQIMESMKANLKPEMTELEMNLHPASLGNVRVNLASQNGQITAQFLAQNETVKTAIENQMIQLTKQFEEQGIKVDHVEVAVADYKFDQGTENGNGQNGDPQHGQERARTARIRRIDLNAMDGETDIDELEDSDRIAAEMMAENGNTVDYTV